MGAHNFDFAWNAAKAALNERHHQITFDEATTVFSDPYAYISFDAPHADDEPREIIIGFSNRNRLLFVAFVERHPQQVRIISARKVTPLERKLYEKKTR